MVNSSTFAALPSEDAGAEAEAGALLGAALEAAGLGEALAEADGAGLAEAAALDGAAAGLAGAAALLAGWAEGAATGTWPQDTRSRQRDSGKRRRFDIALHLIA
jgi:hypothetical protein